ncbi:MAG: sulfurtransferase TusA family protein [Cellvibrionaceae bacterium]
MSQTTPTDLPVDQELDASGLNCPMPLLKAKRALNELESGQCLKVIATDPGSQRDIASFAKLAGHDLLHQTEQGDQFLYWIKKA